MADKIKSDNEIKNYKVYKKFILDTFNVAYNSDCIGKVIVFGYNRLSGIQAIATEETDWEFSIENAKSQREYNKAVKLHILSHPNSVSEKEVLETKLFEVDYEDRKEYSIITTDDIVLLTTVAEQYYSICCPFSSKSFCKQKTPEILAAFRQLKMNIVKMNVLNKKPQLRNPMMGM